MKNFIEGLLKLDKSGLKGRMAPDEQTKRQVNTLFGILSDLYGSDKLIMKAGKLEALDIMKSENICEKVLALQRIILENPTLDEVPKIEDIPNIIEELEDEIASIIARRSVEDELEKRIHIHMQERHEDYVKEIKMQILKEESGPENAHTLKKLALLEKLGRVQLTPSTIDLIRPSKLEEVVGQQAAIQALLAKIASPYPQHVILYGPPGVGKTTVARLALQKAKRLPYTPFSKEATFIEADGTTMRWDPREISNPLLGSVHDPIYQGARKDLAEGGIPEPKTGMVTEAHGGVLFIDEIGELDIMLQNKLLKVLEDKRVQFESPYYDPSDPNLPQYVKKLFEEGAPADFVLIGATTRDPSDISPAIRSRCAEVYFEPLSQKQVEQIVIQAAHKLKVKLAAGVPEIISRYTIEGRKAVGILADAYGMVLYRNEKLHRNDQVVRISEEDVIQITQTSRLVPHAFHKAQDRKEIGHVFGLGVSGYMGSVIEIEALAFPVAKEGKGTIRFNETAGSMAKDSVFNATSLIRKVSGKDPAQYDIHVNVIGGGNIDGPSAGGAIFIVLLSVITEKPIRQDIAMTGEISIQGNIRAVGGIVEKIYGAKQAGMKKVLIPKENKEDVPVDLKGIEVIFIDHIDDVMREVF